MLTPKAPMRLPDAGGAGGLTAGAVVVVDAMLTATSATTTHATHSTATKW